MLAEIAACRACAHEFTHEPRPVTWVQAETRLLIVGQAPGRRVHESGRPFTDASGDKLRQWMGVDAATFYGDPRIGVASQAFCYPGTNPKGEFAFFNVLYEDDSQRSNRRVPAELLGGLNGDDEVVREFILSQDRETAEKSGKTPLEIKSIPRVGAKKK